MALKKAWHGFNGFDVQYDTGPAATDADEGAHKPERLPNHVAAPGTPPSLTHHVISHSQEPKSQGLTIQPSTKLIFFFMPIPLAHKISKMDTFGT